MQKPLITLTFVGLLIALVAAPVYGAPARLTTLAVTTTPTPLGLVTTATPTSQPTSSPTAAATITPTVALTLPSTATPAPVVYTVQRGDTLWGLAQKFNTTVSALKAANGLTADRIDTGQQLIVSNSAPPPTAVGAAPTVAANTPYLVQRGDTLWGLAQKFNTTVAAIKAANQLIYDWIYAGQRLTLPVAGNPASVPTSKPTAGAPAAGSSTYVIKSGDTLFSIARTFGVTVAALKAANGLTYDWIYPGQQLTLPAAGNATGVPTPKPTSGAVTTPAPTTVVSGATTYVVKSGDTLFSIARKFGVTVTALKIANGLSSDWIYAGQRLTVPAGGTGPVATPTPASGTTATPKPTSGAAATPAGTTTYIVKNGDTLFSIARKFGVTVAALKIANGLSSDWIYAGQRLTIPAGGASPSASATSASTTVAPTAGPTLSGAAFELGGQVNGLSAAAKMQTARMTWVKVQLKWAPGQTASSPLIAEAHNQGFRILFSVTGSTTDIANSANFDSYAAFVGELARLGADGIEVWNEMNLDREWPAGQISPTTYTDLLRRAYTQIKAKNPNTLVISGAPAPTGAEGAFGLDHVWNDDRYLNGLVAAGAGNYMDCLGVHYNEGILSPTQSTGDPRANDYYTRYYSGMVNTYYNAFGGQKKLCFTELGYLTPEGYGTLPAAFSWAGNTTVAQQAQWLGEAVTLSRTSGKVRLLIVFNVDFTLWGDDPQGGYAILRPGGSCPACDTLRISMTP